MSKRVLITGGGSGIGKTMAETFAAEGARIFITDLSDTALAECPDSWLKMTGDASDPAHMRAVFDHIESEWGGIDVVCANAGIAGPTALIEDVEPEDFRRCVAVNLEGAFLAAKYAAPMMKAQKSGVILITSSNAGINGFPNPMDFGLSEEQKLIAETTRAFVENELYPHEADIEHTGVLDMELVRDIQKKAIEAGLYAANIPEEFGGAGLDTLTWLLYEKELGRANYALHWTCVARPSNILCAGTEVQREKYLVPCVRGEKWDCLAMTEPGAGSDLRGMKATAKQDGGDWVLNGTKHFISHADIADFAICFMKTGEEDTPRGSEGADHGLFRRQGHARLRGARRLPQCQPSRLHQRNPRIRRLPHSAENVLGEMHKGFEVANTWLGATRLQVGATCLGRAERAFAHAVEYAAGANSSASRSASSRASPSSSPTWRSR
jgi:alkylation response protein AidB-like acyl-CoA dehydrogenase